MPLYTVIIHSTRYQDELDDSYDYMVVEAPNAFQAVHIAADKAEEIEDDLEHNPFMVIEGDITDRIAHFTDKTQDCI